MDWKKVMKKAAGAAISVGEFYVDEAKDLQDRIERKMEIYDKYDDDELRRKLKTTSDINTKRAIIQILKNRGY